MCADCKTDWFLDGFCRKSTSYCHGPCDSRSKSKFLQGLQCGRFRWPIMVAAEMNCASRSLDALTFSRSDLMDESIDPLKSLGDWHLWGPYRYLLPNKSVSFSMSKAYTGRFGMLPWQGEVLRRAFFYLSRLKDGGRLAACALRISTCWSHVRWLVPKKHIGSSYYLRHLHLNKALHRRHRRRRRHYNPATAAGSRDR